MTEEKEITKRTKAEEIANGITTWKLRRAPKENWSKIVQYDHTTFKLAPLVHGGTGRPATGLTQEMAKELALAMGRKEDEYYDHQPFWIDFFIPIGSDTIMLDLHNMEDRLKFYFLKSHPFVAFQHSELKTKSSALFVLYNDVDEAKAQNKGRNSKKLAYAKFNEMDNQEMIDVLLVMGERVVSTDPNIIEAQMGRLVEKRPAEFVDIFGDEDFRMKLFITKCMYFDILERGRGKDIHEMRLSYNSEVIGDGLGEAVKFLNKTANQRIYLALQKRLELSQGAGTIAAGNAMTKGMQLDEKLQAKPVGERATTVVNDEVNKVSAPGKDSGEFDKANELL